MALTASREGRVDAAWSLALCAAVLLAYAAALDNDFLLWDDQQYVTENPLVTHPTLPSLGRLLRTVIALNWHPVTMGSLWMNARLWGTESAGHFIAVSVALHAVNTVLVFLLARRLAGGDRLVAAAAALALGLHPMHVESVAWVSGRKDVLFALFYLLALLFHERRLTWGHPAWLAAAWTAFLLSCLSKAVAVSLPAVLLLLDVHAGRSLKDPRVWREKAPFFALALLVGGLAWNIQGGGEAGGWLAGTGIHRARDTSDVYPLVQRLQFVAHGYLQYLLKFLVPRALDAFYPYPSPAELQGPLHWRFTCAPFLVGAVWAGALAALRWTKVPALCLAFYTLTLAPVAQLVPVGRALMADRYSYLPHLGPAVAAGCLAAALARRKLIDRRAIWAMLALAAALWGGLTFRQTGFWRSDDTLWERVISHNPDNGVLRLVRGHAHGKAGRYDLAIRDFERAIAVGFETADVYEGLGNAYGSLGEPRLALQMFDLALALDPESGSIRLNRGIARMALGDHAAAIADFSESLPRLPPERRASTLRLRAQARGALGDEAGAAADDQAALGADQSFR